MGGEISSSKSAKATKPAYALKIHSLTHLKNSVPCGLEGNVFPSLKKKILTSVMR